MRRQEQPRQGPQRVTMLKTMPGSEDGIRVREYVKGETYEMGAALAGAFLDSKCAVPAKDAEGNGHDKGPGKSRAGKGPDENK